MNTISWKSELKKLKLESIKKKAPGFFEASGGYQMKTTPYNDNTLAALLKSCRDYVSFTNIKVGCSADQGKVRVNVKENPFHTGSFPDFLKGLQDRGFMLSGHMLEIAIEASKPATALPCVGW